MQDKIIHNYKEKYFKKVGYKSEESYQGTVKVMCPNCFSLFECIIKSKNSTLINQEKSDIFIYYNCKPQYIIDECVCGAISNYGIELDYNIADIISELNKKGFYTRYCCEGHLSGSIKPYIMFQEKKIMEYYNILPFSWDINLSFLKYNNKIVFESDYYNKEEALKDIKEFVDLLPNLNS